MNFLLPVKARDLVLEYLMTRPFAEVEGGVYLLRNLKEEEVQAEADVPKAD